jgi:ADP-ribosylglycohydrolase
MHPNVIFSPKIAAIFGALIADSASLGLHWLYDPDRIAKIAAVEGLVFLSPKAENYTNTKGFFAHANKKRGDSSGYGELCLLLLQHFAKHGHFKQIDYQTEYCAHFGPGGTYVGYIDFPTRQTLQTLLPLKPAAFPAISGADDDQFAALASVPVMVAAHQGTQDALISHIETIVRITNNNEIAVAAAQCAGMILFKILNGATVEQALIDSLSFAGPVLKPLLEQSIAYKSLDSIAVSKRFGSACHVAEGFPLIFHIAQHAPDYRIAIEENIRVGGDSCGRSIMLGAIIAAHKAKQANLESAIPLVWMARYRKLLVAANACAQL